MIDAESQNNLGKEIVAKLGKLPTYGAIVWWDGTSSQPLDGATADWGIDVQTVDRNDPDHKYDPNGKRNYPKITKTKNHAAHEMGLQGILGILVVLDYRSSTAEIHVKEMPLKPTWYNDALQQGAFSWRKYNAPKLLDSIKFKNPMTDHRSHLPLT